MITRPHDPSRAWRTARAMGGSAGLTSLNRQILDGVWSIGVLYVAGGLVAIAWGTLAAAHATGGRHGNHPC